MAKRKKTWQEKLEDDKDLPKISKVDEKLSKRWGEGTFVIPAPREVDAVMKRVPKGKLITINEIRTELARQHGTDMACPITTGIFAWIAANAAHEAEQAGRKRVTPYWRTLKTGGEINAKYPGGAEAAAKRLKAEGHKVVQKGKRMVVLDYDKRLVKL